MVVHTDQHLAAIPSPASTVRTAALQIPSRRPRRFQGVFKQQRQAMPCCLLRPVWSLPQPIHHHPVIFTRLQSSTELRRFSDDAIGTKFGVSRGKAPFARCLQNPLPKQSPKRLIRGFPGRIRSAVIVGIQGQRSLNLPEIGHGLYLVAIMPKREHCLISQESHQSSHDKRKNPHPPAASPPWRRHCVFIAHTASPRCPGAR